MIKEIKNFITYFLINYEYMDKTSHSFVVLHKVMIRDYDRFHVLK